MRAKLIVFFQLRNTSNNLLTKFRKKITLAIFPLYTTNLLIPTKRAC